MFKVVEGVNGLLVPGAVKLLDGRSKFYYFKGHCYCPSLATWMFPATDQPHAVTPLGYRQQCLLPLLMSCEQDRTLCNENIST